MLRHFQICAVEIWLVAAGATDSRTRVIGNDQPARPVEELKGANMAVNPIRQTLIRRRPRKRVGAGSQDGDKQRGWRRLAGSRIVNGNHRPRPIDEYLVAGMVLLPQHHILIPLPAVV